MNKKIFIITLLIIAMLLSACSLNNYDSDLDNYVEEVEEDILTKLKKEYPDATITEENGKYSVISDNIDFTTVADKQQHGFSDRHIYTSMDELLDSLDPLQNVVFIGKKTGQTKQYIPINSKGQINGVFYTNSKVEVKKVFYGDISEGDIVTIKEFYAVFGSKDKAKVFYLAEIPLPEEECFYVVTKNETESLFGDEYYYDIRFDGCFEVEAAKTIVESGRELKYTPGVITPDTYDIIKRDMYNKYIVNGDTALDKEKELAKAQKWAENSGETLTEAQLAKIDELCKKYGEIKK